MKNQKKEILLITGVNGEVGHGLVNKITKNPKYRVVGLYLNNLDPELKKATDVIIKGDVTDKNLVYKIIKKYKIDTIFHLAAILSTTGERNPELAHEVNIAGTFNLLSSANKISSDEKRVIKFIFPSTIAVYGVPDLKVKHKNSRVSEDQFLKPITMYGVNKLYCENLGVYFSKYYKLLDNNTHYLDFRCVRFPGLISADTLPSGGTSDYASEMLHSAAKGVSYNCFVRPDSTIHFMAMPDAIDAILKLSITDRSKLTTSIYNIRGFSASAKDIEKIIKRNFQKAKIAYIVNAERQKIIDSWSEDVDDSKAVKDWGWRAKYNFKDAFEKYLIPSVKKRYS